MPTETRIALFTIAATAAFTPGPNNALVASSGANYGVMRTMPHIMGIVIGFPVMIFLIGLFLGEIFQQSPVLRETLRYLGAGALSWTFAGQALTRWLTSEIRRRGFNIAMAGLIALSVAVLFIG